MNHQVKTKNLSAEEMSRVSGGAGMGPSDCGGCHHFLIEGRRRQIFEKMKLKMEQTADIRMRASEDALKAEMRLNKQEADIKEAMKAQREALGLN